MPVTVLDDSFVNKSRARKSHALACDFSECECFGMGRLKCSLCSACFHDDCARRAGCMFLDGPQEEVICGDCAATGGAQGTVAAEVQVAAETAKSLSIRTAVVAGTQGAAGLRDAEDEADQLTTVEPPEVQPANDVQSLAETLNRSFEKIDATLADIGKTLVDFNVQVCSNKADISLIRADMQAFDARLRAAEASSSANGAAAPLSTVQSVMSSDTSSFPLAGNTTDLASELQDRMYRSSNLMLYNLQASADVGDVDLVRKVLEPINNINVQAISVRRFTKSSKLNMPPPIIVRFSSREEVGRVLRGWKRLQDGVRVSPDHTKAQRDQYNALKREVTQHNSTHPTDIKMVRFINGVPTVQKQKI